MSSTEGNGTMVTKRTTTSNGSENDTQSKRTGMHASNERSDHCGSAKSKHAGFGKAGRVTQGDVTPSKHAGFGKAGRVTQGDVTPQ
jgi:hypothetical protein